ncbi:MAG: NAD(P)/FAD-dependent oxidoreductase [Bdellovibrionales bacterium]|nr:NAD(P)/FAD-dependent oxidoreductase [Bdellovibrionales bacterium]
MVDTIDVDLVIIGAGVVGLAVAADVAATYPGKTILVLERHGKLGQETSSRNSEVIHAGIYYAGSPLKQSLCLEGKELLYAFCNAYHVPHRQCGKWIVSTHEDQSPALDKLLQAATTVGVALEERSAFSAQTELANPQIKRALWSSSTGIVDSHSLMLRLEAIASQQGVLFQYGTEVQAIDFNDEGSPFVLVARTVRDETLAIRARCLINSAGLSAARIANAWPALRGMEIRPCRGRYYSLSSRFGGRYSSLVYPLPDPRGGLGVHLTLDLNGRCRLGPDVDWEGCEGKAPDDSDLLRFGQEEPALRESFLRAGRALIPDLELTDLQPDYIGVRPKLFVAAKLQRDFAVVNGGHGDIHLLGIESPGLTSALALAKRVSGELKDRL